MSFSKGISIQFSSNNNQAAGVIPILGNDCAFVIPECFNRESIRLSTLITACQHGDYIQINIHCEEANAQSFNQSGIRRGGREAK